MNKEVIEECVENCAACFGLIYGVSFLTVSLTFKKSAWLTQGLVHGIPLE